MNKKLYIKHLLKQYRPFLILSLFICLAGPLQTLIGGFSRQIDMVNMDKAYVLKLYYIQLNLPTLAIILSIIMPFVVFKHLYNKADLDNYWSVPAKKSDFFLTHFFTGYVFLVVIPLSLAYILNYTFKYFQAYELLAGNVSLVRLVSGLSILLINSFSFYVPTVLAIVMTTSMFNGVIVAGSFQLFFPLIHLLCVSIVNSDPSLLTVNDNMFMNFYWLNLPMTHINYFITIFDNDGISRIPMLVWGLISIGLFFITMKMHDRRKVERIGSSDMFKGFYQTLIFVLGLVILTFTTTLFIQDSPLTITNMRNFFPLFISGLILFFIVQISRWHGKPPIVKNMLTYVCIFFIAIGMSYVLTVPVKNHLIMSQPKAEEIERIEILNPVNNDSDYYRLLNIGNIQHNKAGAINPFTGVLMNSRKGGYVDQKTGLPLSIDPELENELNPANLDRNRYDPFSYDHALEGSFPSGSPLFKSSDMVVLATQHDSDSKSPLNGEINKDNLSIGRASQDPNYFRSKNYMRVGAYSFNYFTNKEAIKSILSLERKYLEKYVRENLGQTAYSPGIFVIKQGPDGLDDYSNQSVYIRILAYDKNNKLIKARQLEVLDKEDLGFIQKIFNGKLFHANGVQYQE